MRSRSAQHHLISALTLWTLAACAGSEHAPAPRPTAPRAPAALPSARPATATSAAIPAKAPSAPPASSASAGDAGAGAGGSSAEAEPERRCAGVPPLGPDGAVPAPPPHTPLGEELEVPGDRPAYVLPGNPEDLRVILYLHGMCGDVTAPDHFREAARSYGTLLALRGDTPCPGERFKWRDEPSKMRQRIQSALQHLNRQRGLQLSLDGVILFGYSQGADRAEKLAQHYPKLFTRLVLGGPPMRASPIKLSAAKRVAILGGELETTETMRAGVEALQTAGIVCRYFELECAYHGWYGTRAEQQLSEVLAWVSEP